MNYLRQDYWTIHYQETNIMNKRDLKKLLNESLIEPSPALKIIMAQNNPDYLEIRAMEFVAEARSTIAQGVDPVKKKMYHEKIINAITLLILARSLRVS